MAGPRVARDQLATRAYGGSGDGPTAGIAPVVSGHGDHALEQRERGRELVWSRVPGREQGCARGEREEGWAEERDSEQGAIRGLTLSLR